MLPWKRAKTAGPAAAPLAVAPTLADRARAEPPGSRGPLYEEAGDHAARAGDPRLAKTCWGHAVDDYLATAQYELAVAACRRILAYDPQVVRAHCTLAFLAVGRRFRADAAEEIDAYVRAARRTGTEKYAIPRLLLMFRATDDAGVHARLAEALRELGGEKAADAVLKQARNASAGAQLPAPEQDEARWNRLVRTALLGPA